MDREAAAARAARAGRRSGSRHGGVVLSALIATLVAACANPTPSRSGPLATLAADPTPSATAAPTLSAVTPPPGRVFYMAPDGSDAGSGTLSSPWRTILGASRHLKSGDTVYVRGGVYHDPGGYDWTSTASGTAAAPITIRAYPGEQPVFDGGASRAATGPDSNPQQALIVKDVSYVTFEGLSFTRFDPYDNGLFVVVSSDHIRFVGIRGYGEFTSADSEHFFYITHSSDVVIDSCFLDGIAGAAVHIYSSDYKPGSGAVSSRNVSVLGSVLTNNGHWGILAGSGLAGGRFAGNVVSSGQIGVEFDSPTSGVAVADNVIVAPIGIRTDLEAYGGYGPATEIGDCIQADVPFKVGWPGEAWSLGEWQLTGRGQGTTVGTCRG